MKTINSILETLKTRTAALVVPSAVVFAIVSFLGTSQQANAQAWGKSSKVLTLGVGVSNYHHLDGYYYGDPDRIRRAYVPTTGMLVFQGEFGVHKYVGLGFHTGFGGRGRWSRDYVGGWHVPVGMLTNFHFYQLIADNTSRNIHADVLDIYAGLSLGTGVAVSYFGDGTVRGVPLLYGGPHVGIRWYFAPAVGLTAELGYGKNVASAGFVFKL